MAEGLFREAAGERYESLSAGAAPAGFVHPLAIAALEELGIDITGQDSKHIRDFLPPRGTPPDLVISVCDAAARECPTFPGKVARLSWPFPDPIYARGSDEQRLVAFRAVRDSIRERIRAALAEGEIDAVLA
jgi:arsenate reductase